MSCLGRARKTAEPIETALGRKAVVLDWLQEFRAKIDKKYGGQYGIPWDFAPAFWTEIPELYGKDTWYDAEIMGQKPVKSWMPCWPVMDAAGKEAIIK